MNVKIILGCFKERICDDMGVIRLQTTSDEHNDTKIFAAVLEISIFSCNMKF